MTALLGRKPEKTLSPFSSEYALDFKVVLLMYVLSSYPELKYLSNVH